MKRFPVLRIDVGTKQTRLRAFIKQKQWEDWRYLAPFFLLVALFLLVVWRFLGPPMTSVTCEQGLKLYRISKGDTCWQIAQERDMTVDALTKINKGLNCNNLMPGKRICVP